MLIAALVISMALVTVNAAPLFTAFGYRFFLKQADPDYERRLFAPWPNSLVARMPLNPRVLFFAPAPAKIATTIRVMRYLYATSCLLIVAAVATVAAAWAFPRLF